MIQSLFHTPEQKMPVMRLSRWLPTAIKNEEEGAAAEEETEEEEEEREE